MSSSGNECARSSRRGAGLTSSSLGGGLDPDGQQGHTVITQKRKLRTPVWARLRNIHISETPYDRIFPRNPLRYLLSFSSSLSVDVPPSIPYSCRRRSLSSSLSNDLCMCARSKIVLLSRPIISKRHWWATPIWISTMYYYTDIIRYNILFLL